MTIEELRQKPEGVLDTRSITLDGNFIAFSPQGGGYGSRSVIETDMVKLINDKQLSDNAACDIYHLCPQLSYHWMYQWDLITRI